MYCPQCATPNADDVKFCRSCGRELEMVALAFSGKSTKPLKADANQDWMEKRIEGCQRHHTRIHLAGSFVSDRRRHRAVHTDLFRSPVDIDLDGLFRLDGCMGRDRDCLRY